MKLVEHNESHIQKAIVDTIHSSETECFFSPRLGIREDVILVTFTQHRTGSPR